MSDLISTEQNRLRYPIGNFDRTRAITNNDVQQFVQDIKALPRLLRQAVHELNEEQLDTPYRPGGWTVRQVVHHLADSHINSYVRFKLALTEKDPVIKPYDEGLWAELSDGKQEAVEVSLVLIETLHRRWVTLLNSLTEAEWQRCFVHPESGKTSLQVAAGLYAWHGQHHLTHIVNLRQAQSW